MTHLSKNGVSIAALIVLVFGYFGVELETETVADAVAAVILLASVVGSIYNQITRQDVKWFFFKK